MDESTAIDQLRALELKINQFEHPEKELFYQYRRLLKIIHLCEIQRCELTGIIPCGCCEHQCEFCTSHQINHVQRHVNRFNQYLRWNAHRQAWQRLIWTPATLDQVAQRDAEEEDAGTGLTTRLAAADLCWRGDQYGEIEEESAWRWNAATQTEEIGQWQ